jgi:hypothetical protein
MRLYHGTDLDSARRLLAGAPLDPSRATALKIDGPDGFFLATELPDAEFFALRQFRGPAAIIAYEVTSEALERLRDAGAIDRPIPRGPRSPRFLGDELFIPPEAFPAYNQLVATGEIRAVPVSQA